MDWRWNGGRDLRFGLPRGVRSSLLGGRRQFLDVVDGHGLHCLLLQFLRAGHDAGLDADLTQGLKESCTGNKGITTLACFSVT